MHEAVLQTLLRAWPDHIFVKDRQGRFIMANASHFGANCLSQPSSC